MPKTIDTTVQDWASKFMEESNDEDQLILPASIEPIELAKYISSLGNSNGGNILLGAYSQRGYATGFQNVDGKLVEQSRSFLDGVDFEVSLYNARLQNIYLLSVSKSKSLAFADGSPYALENGKPMLISERQIIEKLGLGVDSSLINMISEQISKQSSKVDSLSTELKEKSKIKNQVPGLLAGAILGWLSSTILNVMFGL